MDLVYTGTGRIHTLIDTTQDTIAIIGDTLLPHARASCTTTEKQKVRQNSSFIAGQTDAEEFCQVGQG
jgi:hypothetical protein